MIKKLLIITSASMALAAMGGINSSQADKCSDALNAGKSACQAKCGSGTYFAQYCNQICTPTTAKLACLSCSKAASQYYTDCNGVCYSTFGSFPDSYNFCKGVCSAGETAVSSKC